MGDFSFAKHKGRDFDGLYFTGFAIVLGDRAVDYKYVTVHSDKYNKVIKLEHGNRFDFDASKRKFPIEGLEMPTGRYDIHESVENGTIYRLATKEQL